MSDNSIGAVNAEVFNPIAQRLKRESPYTCLVSFTGPAGIRHGVEVTAETLYEAAALGLNMLRNADWTDQIAAGTPIEVRVREPDAMHCVTLAQIRQWWRCSQPE